MLLDYLNDPKFTLLVNETLYLDFLRKMHKFSEEHPGIRAGRILEKLLSKAALKYRPFEEN